MSFRSSEFLQRNELVRFELDDVIRAPANGQHQAKNRYRLLLMIDQHSMTGITLILKSNSRYRSLLVGQLTVLIG